MRCVALWVGNYGLSRDRVWKSGARGVKEKGGVAVAFRRLKQPHQRPSSLGRREGSLRVDGVRNTERVRRAGTHRVRKEVRNWGQLRQGWDTEGYI